jgi:hypothetical protein
MEIKKNANVKKDNYSDCFASDDVFRGLACRSTSS